MTQTDAKKPSVWVIKTDSIGELRCREGIAQKINPDYSTEPIQGKSPKEIRKYYEEKFNTHRLLNNERWPDFIISSGVKSIEAAKEVKRLSGGRTFIIQNLNPKVYHDDCGVLAIPEHIIKPEHQDLANVITTIGVPHAVTDERINAGKQEWEEQFSILSSPKIAVLLGGDTREFKFTPKRARDMARKLNAKAKVLGASLIITTSARTDKKLAKAFMDEITVPAYVHDWERDAAKGNPYFGILGLADAIVVTGDSMSMCCEASCSKKPVYIYAFEGNRVGLRNLHNQLYDRKLAKPFQSLLDEGVKPWEYAPLDTAGIVAAEALKRWHAIQLEHTDEKILPFTARITNQRNGNTGDTLLAKDVRPDAVDGHLRKLHAEQHVGMGDELLDCTIKGLSALKTALNEPDSTLQREFLRAVDMVKEAHGRILITGVGKSLRVGEVVAASFGSLGIPCEIIDPNHALHGDMGKIDRKAGNILIAISKSGNTEELKPVVNKARKRGLKIISVTHTEDSFLGETAAEAGEDGVMLQIPATEEPHPFPENDTKVSPPTVSTTQVKVLLESIALAVAKSKGMDVSQFGENHPAGALGHASKIGSKKSGRVK